MATLVGDLPLALKHGPRAWSSERCCANVSVRIVPKRMGFRGSGVLAKGLGFGVKASRVPDRHGFARARASAAAEIPMCSCLGELQGFVEELRFQAIRLHTREPENEASVEEYLKFLADSKMVYETMEAIVVLNSSHPACELHPVTPINKLVPKGLFV